MAYFSRLIFILFALWLIGFIFYVLNIQFYPQKVTESPDAIVVLTGGSNRVEEGLEIMSQYGCQNLFISGVNKNVSRHDILKRIQKNKNIEGCQLELGYTARNTHENAQEVIAWIKKKKYKSIVLVTAYYHMPRSLLEFRSIAPDLIIQPYAVFPDSSIESFIQRILLLAKEYHKLIAAWLRIYIFMR